MSGVVSPLGHPAGTRVLWAHLVVIHSFAHKCIYTGQAPSVTTSMELLPCSGLWKAPDADTIYVALGARGMTMAIASSA